MTVAVSNAAELVAGLRLALKARKVPLTLVDGPHRLSTDVISDSRACVIDAQDGWSFPKGSQTNPVCVNDVMVGLTLIVEGCSPAAGATYRDHHDYVRALVYQCAIALRTWAHAESITVVLGPSGRWDPSTAEVEGGARYLLPITVEDCVQDVSWATVHPTFVVSQYHVVDGVNRLEDPAPVIPEPEP
jgi:hypothetical protein